MADNYLEKKMEDYRRGPVSRRRLSLPRRQTGEPVFVAAGELTPVVAAIVSSLTADNRPVYFTIENCNRREAMNLAGATGATYDPDAANAREHFGARYGSTGSTVAIDLAGVQADVYVGSQPNHSGRHSVNPDRLSPAEIAGCVLFLSTGTARAIAPLAISVDSEVGRSDA